MYQAKSKEPKNITFKVKHNEKSSKSIMHQ